MTLRTVASLGLLAGSMLACGGNQTSRVGGDAGAEACDAGKTAYQKHRQALLAKLAQTTCAVDADCGVLWEANACAASCGTAAPAGAIDGATAELNDFANKNCGSCQPIPIPPCAPPGPLTCQQGRCGGG
jgi:hypothetical protein